MNRAVILAILSSSAAACVTSLSTDNGATTAAPASASGGASTAADAGSDESVIEVVDVPQAATVADSAVLRTRQERVCHHEKRTGSNRVVRVCRTRAQIEREELESRELFDDLHRSQQEYGH